MSRNPGPDPNSTNNTVLKTKRLELSFGSDQDARDLFPFVHGEPGRKVTNTLLWDGPETVEDIAGFFRNTPPGPSTHTGSTGCFATEPVKSQAVRAGRWEASGSTSAAPSADAT
jgi:hypothetical protein